MFVGGDGSDRQSVGLGLLTCRWLGKSSVLQWTYTPKQHLGIITRMGLIGNYQGTGKQI